MVDVSRREFLRRTGVGAGGIVSLGALPALLAACGGDDESGDTDGSAASGSEVVKPKIGLSSTPQATYLPVIAGPILAGTQFGMPKMTVDDFTIFDSSTTVSQSALSGQIDIIGQSTMAQLLLIEKELPFKIFTPFALSDDFVIAGRGDVTTVEQLMDPSTVVASDSPGGAGQTVFDAMLKAAGADFLVTDIPKKVIIESSGERASALASGDCDATSIHLPQFNEVAKETKATIIARLYGEVPNFLKETYAARADWLEQNVETAAAVTASVIQASRDLKATYEAFESACNELMEEPPPAAELRELYEIIQEHDIFPVNGDLTDDRVQYMIDLGKEEGLIKSDMTPDSVIDRRPMERAMEMLES